LFFHIEREGNKGFYEIRLFIGRQTKKITPKPKNYLGSSEAYPKNHQIEISELDPGSYKKN